MNANDPAFPIYDKGTTFPGLTKREILTAVVFIARGKEWADLGCNYEKIAKFSVDQADALLAALEKDSK